MYLFFLFKYGNKMYETFYFLMDYGQNTMNMGIYMCIQNLHKLLHCMFKHIVHFLLSIKEFSEGFNL